MNTDVHRHLEDFFVLVRILPDTYKKKSKIEALPFGTFYVKVQGYQNKCKQVGSRNIVRLKASNLNRSQ